MLAYEKSSQKLIFAEAVARPTISNFQIVITPHQVVRESQK